VGDWPSPVDAYRALLEAIDVRLDATSDGEGRDGLVRIKDAIMRFGSQTGQQAVSAVFVEVVRRLTL
jgi:hypothetical protein